MAVRSKCLQPPANVPVAVTTIHTVSAGETTLVKWLSLVNSSAVDRNVSVYISAGSGDQRVALVPVLAQTQVQLEVWWVLHPGWLLRWSSPGSITGAVFGSELEGVAD